jgi:hypothetical protein
MIILAPLSTFDGDAPSVSNLAELTEINNGASVTFVPQKDGPIDNKKKLMTKRCLFILDQLVNMQNETIELGNGFVKEFVLFILDDDAG